MKIIVDIKIKDIHDLSEVVDEMEKTWKEHPNIMYEIKIEVQKVNK